MKIMQKPTTTATNRIQRTPRIRTRLGSAVIFHHPLVNGKVHGAAVAQFNDFVIHFRYNKGIKSGPARKTFADGSIINFTYRRDQAEGPARKILPTGEEIHFIYRKGIAQEL